MKKIVLLLFVVLPCSLFAQRGMNIRLLKPASGSGYTVLTDSTGRQTYVLFADLIAEQTEDVFVDSLKFRNGYLVGYYRNRIDSVRTAIDIPQGQTTISSNPQIFALATNTANKGIFLSLSGTGSNIQIEGRKNVTIKKEGTKLIIEGESGGSQIFAFSDTPNGVRAELSGTGAAMEIEGKEGVKVKREGVKTIVSLIEQVKGQIFAFSNNVSNGDTLGAIIELSETGAQIMLNDTENATFRAIGANIRLITTDSFVNILGLRDTLLDHENRIVTLEEATDNDNQNLSFTFPNLSISGGNNQSLSALREWANITDIPTGFADGIDNNDNDVDYISNVTFSGNNLNFSKVGNAFLGNISLANIQPAWANITGIPAGFADGIDNNDNDVDYISNVTFSGNNLNFSKVGNAFLGNISLANIQPAWANVSGKPTSFASNWNTMSNIPSGFADGVDNTGTDTNYYPTSFSTISNNILTLNRSGLGSITTDLSPLQANWNLVFNKPSTFASNWNTMSNIPSGFADGVDNTGTDTNYYPTSLSVSGSTLKTITISGVGMPSISGTFEDLSGTGTTPNIFSNHVITANYSGGTQFTGTTISPDNTSDNITYSNQDAYIQIYGNATSDAVWWGLNEANVREYINPDEELTEKSTNQFNYLNQLIYKRTFNFGSVSANSTETQSLSINSLENLITRVRDVGSTNQHIGGSQVDLTTETGEIEVWAAGGNIHVKNTSASVGVNSVIVTVYYTK